MASSPAAVWSMLMKLGYTHELHRSSDGFIMMAPDVDARGGGGKGGGDRMEDWQVCTVFLP